MQYLPGAVEAALAASREVLVRQQRDLRGPLVVRQEELRVGDNRPVDIDLHASEVVVVLALVGLDVIRGKTLVGSIDATEKLWKWGARVAGGDGAGRALAKRLCDGPQQIYIKGITRHQASSLSSQVCL